jgi:hypothetical protein
MPHNLLIFIVLIVIACLAYPPMFGLFIGMGLILLLNYIFMKLFGQ